MRRQWVTFLAGIGVILLAIGFFFVGPLILTAYDDSHRESLTCTVSSVETVSGRSSNRGVGGASALVRVGTDACGVLDLRDGVTIRNVDAIASELKEGETYVFSVGQGSLRLEPVLQFFKQQPLILEYRPADPKPR